VAKSRVFDLYRIIFIPEFFLSRPCKFFVSGISRFDCTVEKIIIYYDGMFPPMLLLCGL
jgi:hypothetical protein